MTPPLLNIIAKQNWFRGIREHHILYILQFFPGLTDLSLILGRAADNKMYFPASCAFAVIMYRSQSSEHHSGGAFPLRMKLHSQNAVPLLLADQINLSFLVKSPISAFDTAAGSPYFPWNQSDSKFLWVLCPSFHSHAPESGSVPLRSDG